MDLTDQTCADLFDGALRRYRDRTAVTFRGDDYTYDWVADGMLQIARGLADLGLGKSDRVALLMGNRPEYLTSDLGIVRAGCIEVPLNDMLSRDEITYMLNDTQTSAIIAGPRFVEDAVDIRDDVETLEHVFGLADDPDAALPEDVRSFTDYFGGFDTSFFPAPVSPEDPAYLNFTGGTTGRPKPVLHTHNDWVHNLYIYAITLEFHEDETLLLSTPLPHATGYSLRTGLLKGARAVITQGFDTGETLRLIESESITWTFMVPTMIYRLLDHEDLDDRDTSSLRTVLYGGSPITPTRLEEGIEAFGPVFLQLYGQTEVPNIMTTLSKQEHVEALENNPERLSSCGQPSLMSEVRIVDDDWEPVQTGETGEIAVRAPYVMEEYWGRPDKTLEDLQDGWKRTGDVGKRDEAGFVYLLDRKSDMIVSGGMNVYSPDVEEVLATHENVAQVAVIGVPDAEWGEAVTAVVIPYDEDAADEAELIEYCREPLADYKRPKSVDFVDELPETAYGKIDKTQLRESYWEGEERQIH